jgi:hypothetical protein
LQDVQRCSFVPHRFSRGMPLTFSSTRPSRPSSLLRISAAPVPMKPAEHRRSGPKQCFASSRHAQMRAYPGAAVKFFFLTSGAGAAFCTPDSSPLGPRSLFRCCPIIHSRFRPASGSSAVCQQAMQEVAREYACLIMAMLLRASASRGWNI